MASAIAAPAISLGPVGWAIGGAILLGGIFLAKKHNDDHNLPHLHDNHNHGNPNNRGPNGDPIHPYYYHMIMAKSKKDAFNRALRDGFGAKPLLDGNHFHLTKFRGGVKHKFGNCHYFWKIK